MEPPRDSNVCRSADTRLLDSRSPARRNHRSACRGMARRVTSGRADGARWMQAQIADSTWWRDPASSMRAISSSVIGGGVCEPSVIGGQSSRNQPPSPQACTRRPCARRTPARCVSHAPCRAVRARACRDGAGLAVRRELDRSLVERTARPPGDVDAAAGRPGTDEAVEREHRASGLVARHEEGVAVARRPERATRFGGGVDRARSVQR
jgi:hypothetical protein